MNRKLKFTVFVPLAEPFDCKLLYSISGLGNLDLRTKE